MAKIPCVTVAPEVLVAVFDLPTGGPACCRVLNMGMPAPDRVVGKWLALHAGACIGLQVGEVAAHGALLDISRRMQAAGWRGLEMTPADVTCSAIRGFVRVAGSTLDGVGMADPYAALGAWHWRLEEVRRLDVPVPCVGGDGLVWTLGEREMAAVGQIVRRHQEWVWR